MTTGTLQLPNVTPVSLPTSTKVPVLEIKKLYKKGRADVPQAYPAQTVKGAISFYYKDRQHAQIYSVIMTQMAKAVYR